MRLRPFTLRVVVVALTLVCAAAPPAKPLSAAENLAETVLVDNNTQGYYNDSLDRVLDGTDLLFPGANSYANKDPYIPSAPEPNLTAAQALLGNWLASPPQRNANWSALQGIPGSWSANRENSIIYPVTVGAQGYARVLGNFGVDNGLFVWVDGVYKFGALGPGAVGGFEYRNIDLGSLAPGQHWIQILREDHGDFGGFTVQITGSPGSAGANITTPVPHQQWTPADQLIAATTWSNSGGAVQQTAFYVLYDSHWVLAGTSNKEPHLAVWTPPNSLTSQILQVRVDITDTVGGRIEYADVVGGLDYRESIFNSSVNENWIPFRVYLNQRILSDGDSMCGAASMAMVLAMLRRVDWDPRTLSRTAEDAWVQVRVPWPTGGYASSAKTIVEEFVRQGLDAAYIGGHGDAQWQTLRDEIDAGRPVIVQTGRRILTEAGHYVVAVGYRETGAQRDLIVYDPFGRWRKSMNSFDANATRPATGDPDAVVSTKGKWATYNFETVTTGMITVTVPASTAGLGAISSVPSSPPDLTSSEPLNPVTYVGVRELLTEIYLPVIRR